MKLQIRNSRKSVIRLMVVLFSVMLCNESKAQVEPMFTQYMFNEPFLNPAFVGSHECISATALYRNQWVGIDGAPVTQTFNFHAPVNKRKLGLGLSLMNEEIGVAHQLTVFGQFSYRILYPHSALSFGIGGGFINDQEKFTKVKTIIQQDPQFATDVVKNFMPNASFGIYFYKKDFYVGLSIPRLIENKILINSENSLIKNAVNYKQWHYYLSSGYVFDLNDEVKFKPSTLIKVNQNAPVEVDLNADFILHDFLWLGAGYRTGDAVSAFVGIEFSKQLLFGYSYDYTLTPLKTFNDGSHELSLRYKFNYNKKLIISTRYF